MVMSVGFGIFEIFVQSALMYRWQKSPLALKELI
jgi:hypothetical protein